MKVCYTKSSEWVSPAHPDRVADVIGATLINEIYKKDGKNAHAAIEIALFDNKVIVGGEVRTTLELTPKKLKPIINKVFDKIGYNQTLRQKFDKQDVYIGNDYKILCFVNQQSPDIAKGTTDLADKEPGFNDQGTYCGFASYKTANRLSYEHFLATSLGEYLYEKAKKSSFLGIDIKTLVQVAYSGNDCLSKDVVGITVAVPTIRRSKKYYAWNEEQINECCLKEIQIHCQEWYFQIFNKQMDTSILLINGTGAYHGHGSKFDSGVAGRKLVVNQCGNFAAGGSMIKPILASDRLLNLYARHIAKTAVDAGFGREVTVELSASIGQTKIGSLKIDGLENNEELFYNYFKNKPLSPNYLNKLWKTLERNNFDEVVFRNFFGSNNYDLQPWEDTTDDVNELKELLYENDRNNKHSN